MNKLWLFRISILIVYFWFGALKVAGLSPAEEMVHALFEKTLASFIPFGTFFVLFGIFECLIGLLYIIKGLEKYALGLMLFHLVTTAMPLVLLPAYTWNGFLVPTLSGQYIIKNVLLVAVVFGVYWGSGSEDKKKTLSVF